MPLEGAPACFTDLLGECLHRHEILEPLLGAAAQVLADESPIDVPLAGLDREIGLDARRLEG